MKKYLKLLCAVLIAATSVCAQAANASDVLSKLKSRIAADKRTAIWDVKVAKASANAVTVTGTVGLPEQKEAISQELAASGFKSVTNNVKCFRMRCLLPRSGLW